MTIVCPNICIAVIFCVNFNYSLYCHFKREYEGGNVSGICLLDFAKFHDNSCLQLLSVQIEFGIKGSKLRYMLLCLTFLQTSHRKIWYPVSNHGSLIISIDGILELKDDLTSFRKSILLCFKTHKIILTLSLSHPLGGYLG